MSISIKDAEKSTTTILNVVSKQALTMKTPRPVVLPPSRGGWTVDRLGPRTIAALQTEGYRFTRTVNPSSGNPVTVSEEDWVSESHGIILEETLDDPRVGKTIKTVTEIQLAEPDPSVFVTPEGFSRLSGTNN